jgi:hypothetical protein
MGLLSGLVSGFGQAADAARQQATAANEAQLQRERGIFEFLLQSPDKETRDAALAGLLTPPDERASKKGGVPGAIGNLFGIPGTTPDPRLETIRQLTQTPVETTREVPGGGPTMAFPQEPGAVEAIAVPSRDGAIRDTADQIQVEGISAANPDLPYGQGPMPTFITPPQQPPQPLIQLPEAEAGMQTITEMQPRPVLPPGPLSPREQEFEETAGRLQATERFGPPEAPELKGTFADIGEAFTDGTGRRWQEVRNTTTLETMIVPVLGPGAPPDPDFPTSAAEIDSIALGITPPRGGLDQEGAQQLRAAQERDERRRLGFQTDLQTAAAKARERQGEFSVEEASRLGIPQGTTRQEFAAIFGTGIIPPTLAGRTRGVSATLVENKLGTVSTLLDRIYGPATEAAEAEPGAIERALAWVMGEEDAKAFVTPFFRLEAITKEQRKQFLQRLTRDPAVIALQTELEGLVVPVARARGDVGNLSETEQENARKLLPILGGLLTFPDPPDIARQKVASLQTTMREAIDLTVPSGLFPSPLPPTASDLRLLLDAGDPPPGDLPPGG